ncbi:MAG: hypothetical protein DSZ06_04710 [Sulfurospirillum sp.]|nr:MAG: hypothetical protein DSZ06_04710 [Sulfurospirillum sp.]
MIFFRFVFFLLLSYGLFYIAYRYFDPGLNMLDIFRYHRMAQHPLVFDRDIAGSPFIYRQFDAILTHLFYQTGLFYNAPIEFTGEDINQRIYFASILSDYTALILTALLVSEIFDMELGRVTLLPALFAGVLCFLSFGTMSFILTGLTEAWGWFFISLGYYALKKENLVLFSIVLIISIFQREIISIIFTVFSFLLFIFSKYRYKAYNFNFLKMSIISFASFVMYVIYRKYLFPISGFSNQLDKNSLLSNLLNFSLTPKLIVTTVIPENIFMIMLLVLAVALIFMRDKIRDIFIVFKMDLLFSIVFTLIFLLMLGMATDIKYDIGRILHTITPIIAVLTAYYLYILNQEFDKNQN